MSVSEAGLANMKIEIERIQKNIMDGDFKEKWDSMYVTKKGEVRYQGAIGTFFTLRSTRQRTTETFLNAYKETYKNNNSSLLTYTLNGLNTGDVKSLRTALVKALIEDGCNKPSTSDTIQPLITNTDTNTVNEETSTQSNPPPVQSNPPPVQSNPPPAPKAPPLPDFLLKPGLQQKSQSKSASLKNGVGHESSSVQKKSNSNTPKNQVDHKEPKSFDSELAEKLRERKEKEEKRMARDNGDAKDVKKV